MLLCGAKKKPCGGGAPLIVRKGPPAFPRVNTCAAPSVIGVIRAFTRSPSEGCTRTHVLPSARVRISRASVFSRLFFPFARVAPPGRRGPLRAACIYARGVFPFLFFSSENPNYTAPSFALVELVIAGILITLIAGVCALWNILISMEINFPLVNELLIYFGILLITNGSFLHIV